MSRELIVAKRYAKALFELAQERGVAAKVEEELKAIVASIEVSAELAEYLKHPGVTSAAKVELLKQLIPGAVSEITENTIQLLVERGRESLLSELYDAYVAIAGEALGQSRAIVTSAAPLGEADARAIAQRFGELTGKQLSIENIVDSSLLGGIQVRIGDRLYDGSLSGKLARLEKSLLQTQSL